MSYYDCSLPGHFGYVLELGPDTCPVPRLTAVGAPATPIAALACAHVALDDRGATHAYPIANGGGPLRLYGQHTLPVVVCYVDRERDLPQTHRPPLLGCS